MNKLLNDFVARLRTAYEHDLLSVVLFGSAASGDYDEKFSDLNVLCVLRVVGVPELRKGAKAIEWWIGKKQPAPLLVSAEEMQNSTDVFPIEFLDMQRNHRVLLGSDPVANLKVSTQHHRRQLEHELRSALLRLRARYLTVQNNEKEVTELMARSLPTVATLARHALILAGGVEAQGAVPIQKQQVIEAAAKRFGLSETPFVTILEIRQGTQQLAGEKLHSLFAAYLEQVTRLAQAVDRL